jgi:GNAT superfamily N-acetyltransferase
VTANRSTTTSGSLTIRSGHIGDEKRLIQLYESCFGRARDADQFAWRYRRGQPTDFVVAELDGLLVGAVAVQLLDGFREGERCWIARGSDLMVDPEYRGTGVAQAMAMPVRKLFRRASLVANFPAEVTFRLYEDSPLKRDGRLPQWIRWESTDALRCDRPGLARAPAAAIVAAGRVAARLSGSRYETSCRELTANFGTHEERLIDALADESASFAKCIGRRGGDYMRRRWLERTDPWRMIIDSGDSEQSRQVTGVMAFKVENGDCRIGDLLCRDRRSMQRLLTAARAATATEGPGRTLLELQDQRPWSRSVLRSAGFLRRGNGPAVTLHSLPLGKTPALGLSSWYLTSGDTDLI